MSSDTQTAGHAAAAHAAAAEASRAGMENYRKLPKRLKRFAEAVASGKTKADAARVIKPDSRRPKGLGWKLSQIPRVKAAIEELSAQAKADFDARYARHLEAIHNRANADRSLIAAAALFGPDAVGLPKDPREWPEELKDCIEGVKLTRQGPELQLSDRLTAARLFSQHMGWLAAERHELTGAGGGPVQTVTIATDDPAEAARAYQELIRGP